jgi:hypothetical protein
MLHVKVFSVCNILCTYTLNKNEITGVVDALEGGGWCVRDNVTVYGMGIGSTVEYHFTALALSFNSCACPPLCYSFHMD